VGENMDLAMEALNRGQVNPFWMQCIFAASHEARVREQLRGKRN
jgi:hypothetical protein